MIMPGVGDSFVSANIRLLFALSIAVVMSPVLLPYLPPVETISSSLMLLVVMEGVIGLFIGTVSRILIAALDVAGMIISMQVGLASAQVFNPGFASQGSIIGALLSVTGVVLIFATNLHHLLIYAVFDSYQSFPPGALPEAGSMAHVIVSTFSKSFAIGFQLAVPFVIAALMTYIAMGVLARVMPQIQVFILALPLQIFLGMTVMLLVCSTLFLFWLAYFEEGVSYFVANP
jgi:flagellar biosynthetic protein FliR